MGSDQPLGVNLMKQILFAIAALTTLVIVSDIVFLHGLTAAIMNAVVSLF